MNHQIGNKTHSILFMEILLIYLSQNLLFFNNMGDVKDTECRYFE